MNRADHIIDLGPGAGVHGGELLASGTPAAIRANDASLTGLFLAKGICHPLRGAYRPVSVGAGLVPTRSKPRGRDQTTSSSAATSWLELRGVTFRNLKNFDLRLPAGRLILAAGPSGAGKSTLFRDVLQSGRGSRHQGEKGPALRPRLRAGHRLHPR
jgi:excinuclease ABC subunit A